MAWWIGGLVGGRLGENVSWRVRRSSIRTNNEMAMGCTTGQGLRMGTKMRWDELGVFRHRQREWEWEGKWEWALFLLLLLGGCHCCSGSMSNDTMPEWESKWDSHFGSFRCYCCGCGALARFSGSGWFSGLNWIVLCAVLGCALLLFGLSWSRINFARLVASVWHCVCRQLRRRHN